MSVSVIDIPNTDFDLGEGPHWDENKQELLFVDIKKNAVHRWSPITKQHHTATFGKTVGAVVPCASNPDEYMLSCGLTLLRYNWKTGGSTVVAEVEKGKPNRFNDGKCDPSGRFWNGTMELDLNLEDPTKLCSLYTLETNGQLKTRIPDVGLSNGLCWTTDNSTMFYIDSKDRQVYGFNFDLSSGNISNKRTVFKMTDAFPDGMTLDENGKIWLACFFGSCVLNFDPATGQEIRRVPLPTPNITSCCFGGKNLDILFVTSDQSLKTDEVEASRPNAGKCFQVTGLGVKGLPMNSYAG